MSNNAFAMMPLRSVINITKLITVLSYELSPNFYTEGETHNFWEMVYVDRGKIYCHADDEVKLLKKGEIIFHQPNEFHSLKCDGVQSASVFIITFDCKSSAMNFFVKAPFNWLRSILNSCVD